MAKSRIQNRVKEYRERVGMTQFELAVAAHMMPAAVSEIESGKREPGLTTALNLAKALETTVDGLFELEKEG